MSKKIRYKIYNDVRGYSVSKIAFEQVGNIKIWTEIVYEIERKFPFNIRDSIIRKIKLDI